MDYLITKISNKKLLHTEKIKASEMAVFLEINLDSAKQCLKRLKRKKIISTTDYSKDPCNGYSVFEIDSFFYKEFKKNRKKTSPIYNNSNNNYYYNNPIKQEKITELLTKQISNQWNEIDISPLENIGFKKDHLEKLSQIENLTPEKVQDSIHQFAWGLKNNPSNYEKYKNHLYVFIGTLKKGQPWTESSYESEEERALKDLIRVKKQKQKEHEKLIDELVDLEFPEWKTGLSQEEINDISPKNLRLGDDVTDSLLKSHFKNEVIVPRLNSKKTKS